jgi:hypothetical protein
LQIDGSVRVAATTTLQTRTLLLSNFTPHAQHKLRSVIQHRSLTTIITTTAVMNLLQVQNVPGEDRAVLMLGYRDQMELMLKNSNPGLERRFALHDAFDFADYTDEELLKILVLKMKKEQLTAKVTYHYYCYHDAQHCQLTMATTALGATVHWLSVVSQLLSISVTGDVCYCVFIVKARFSMYGSYELVISLCLFSGYDVNY